VRSKPVLVPGALAVGIAAALLLSSAASASSVRLGPGWDPAQFPLSVDADGVPKLSTPSVDHERLKMEDIDTWQPGQPLRFAESFKVRITPESHGSWSELADGTAVWRLRIGSPKAKSINLGFSQYRMPEGGELRIAASKGRTALRPFTAADNQDHGELWTPIIPGEEIQLELRLPAAKRAQLALELGAINHAYIEFGKAPAHLKSGACNVDVVCPQGDDWRDQIRSVAVYSRGGSTLCTGALVNNLAQDLKGYFLTANHCGMTAGNAPSMVVYWNYENSTCRPPGSGSSGGPGDGQLTQFSSGATLRANRSNSDFALVELNNPIPSAYNVYWAGWDARPGDFPSVVAIHHPNTDEKRISFENDPTTTTSYLSATVNPDATHIRVADWDLGTTEPGSSGSPLFSPDKRIVGQLHGGYAACGNDLDDWYGRVSRSWADGGTAATQLRDWLDPSNSGQLFVDGRNEIEGPFRLEIAPPQRSLCRIDGSTSFDVEVLVEDGFGAPVALALTGQPPGASVAFSPNPVSGGGISLLGLGDLATAAGGNYNLTVTATSAGEPDAERSALLRLVEASPGALALQSPANGATLSAPVPLSWAAAVEAESYRVEVSTAADFSVLVHEATVAGTSHTVPDLDPATAYFWRVRPDNVCGLGDWSEVRGFTTTDEICRTPALAIPDNNPAGVFDLLTIAEGGELEDLDVQVEITHTWVGDLIVNLTHVESGTSIDLIDRPGVPGSTFGCSGDNINALLDDAAPQPVETQCAAGVPTINGTFSPNQPLSAVNGESLAGTWRLTVSDRAGGDTGTLQRWCLLPSIAPPAFQAVDDSYILNQGDSLAVPAPGVLGNDVGTDLEVSDLITDVANGSLILDADGAFSYTPDPGYCGADGFVYEMTDGVETDEATVSITVLCPASPPQMDDQAFSVAENSPNGTAVGTIVATDPNANPGDTLSFAVTGGSGAAAFAVHPTTGAITVSNSSLLDFETTPSFTLLVTVTDNTELSDSATITIDLTDVDEAPTVPAQSFAIDENSPVGTVVGTVTATDPEGGPFSFAITGGSGAAAFAIDASSGELSVADPALLDFETSPSLSLVVRATDSTELSGSGTITVNLNDVNEAPSIANQGFAVDENSAAGTLVGTIAASDPDAGDTLSFSVTGGSGAGVFAVDANTGEISVLDAEALDFETTPSFTLEVEVEDADGLSDSATITISLNDVNEAPSIADQDFALDENSAVGTVVGTLAASDPDAGDTLAFSVTGGSGAGVFAVDANTGEISVLDAAALDFETTPSFTLEVEVEDADGLSDSATITISLNDVNEAPVAGTLADQSGSEGVAFAFDASVAFSDPDGDALGFSVEGLPASLAIDAGTGLISGVPVLGDAGTYAVVVSASDGEFSVDATFELQIGEAGEAIFASGFED
jgi:lysyl endopeptidase